MLAGSIASMASPPALCYYKPAPPAAKFVPARGLQLSLNTGGYKFLVGDDAVVMPLATAKAQAAKKADQLGGLLPTGEGFAASALLVNASRSGIPIHFADPVAAEVKFTFSVLDADGALVWQSDSGVIAAQQVITVTMGKGERWKRIVQIPLKVDGAWLKSGLYTLEARLEAQPSVSASVMFEVARLSEVPPPDAQLPRPEPLP